MICPVAVVLFGIGPRGCMPALAAMSEVKRPGSPGSAEHLEALEVDEA